MGDAEPGDVGCSFQLPQEPAGAHEVQGDFLSFLSGFEYKAKIHSELHPA